MPPVDADADGSSFAFLEYAIANPTRLKMFGIGYSVPGITFKASSYLAGAEAVTSLSILPLMELRPKSHLFKRKLY